MPVDIASLRVRITSTDAVRSVNRAEDALEDLGNTAEREMDRSTRATEEFGRASRTEGDRASESFKKVRLGLIAVAVAAAAIAGAVIKNAIGTFITFSDTMAELSAITGSTGEDLEFLSEAAKEMGRTTTFSATEAATAFKLMASAKPDLLENIEALKATTEAALTLAEASGLDLPAAADALGLALNQFGAGADQATRFINVLAAGAQKGASEISFTAAALLQAGTVAASIGVSFEKTNAAIQTLAEVGIKGAQAGTGLRNVFLKLEASTDDALRPSLVGLTGALEELESRNLTATQLTKQFGLENVVVAQQLINNVDSLSKYEAALTGTNTATEQAGTRVDTLGGDLKALGSALEGLGLELVKLIEGPLRGFVKMLTNAVNAIGNSFGAIKAAFSAIGLEFAKTIINMQLLWLDFIDFLPGSFGNAVKKMFGIQEDARKKLLELQIGLIRNANERFRAETAPLTIPIRGGAEAPADAITAGTAAVSSRSPTGARPDTALFIQKIKDAQEELNQATSEAARIVDRNRTAQEIYNASLERVNELYASGLLSTDEYNREVNRVTEVLKKSTESVAASMSKNVEVINSTVRGFGSELENFWVGVATTGKFEFSSLVDNVIGDITRMVTRLLIIEPIVKRIMSAVGGGGGGGGAGIVGAIGSVIGAFAGSFEHGGSFDVKGAGGPDSQLVSLAATPGERVTVTPRGEAGANSAPNIVMNINLQSLDPSNAAEVVRQALPAVEQDLVGIINSAYTSRGRRGPLGL